MPARRSDVPVGRGQLRVRIFAGTFGVFFVLAMLVAMTMAARGA